MSLCRLFGILFSAMFLMTGCSGFLPDSHRWGEDVSLNPGWKKAKESAWNALKSPAVWVPAATAMVLQVEDYDERLLDWAQRHHPVFGNKDDADDSSDILKDATIVAYGVSILATPSGPVDGDWVFAKTKGLGVGLAAIGLTAATTGILKDSAGRSRPDKGDTDSFLSGHASQAGVYAALAERNVRTMNIPRWAKITSKATFTALPLATGWARVEANRHYPADVLAGISLGHFFGMFINDLFIGIDQEEFQLTVQPGREGLYAGMSVRY